MDTIVALAEKARILVNEADELEKDKKKSDDLKATLEALTEVKNKVITITTLCSLLADRLSPENIHTTELSRILEEVQSAHIKFTQDREQRQVQPLHNIANRLDNMRTGIELEWKKQANNLIQHHLSLWEVVRYLPEIQKQETVINGLKDKLQRRASDLPQTRDQLNDFDTNLEDLKTRLAHLENLHPEVEAFLHKTYNHEATIADLTHEVLSWCREERRAEVFQVRFPH